MLSEPPGSTPSADPNEPFYDWFDHGAQRAVAITLPVLLEELLEQILSLNLRPDRQIAAEFFRPTGPLGNFGAKARMAYMMRILDEHAYRDMMTIAKIRNRFAHGVEVKSFEDSAIKGWVTSLNAYKSLERLTEREVSDDDPECNMKRTLQLIIKNNMESPMRAFRECVRWWVRALSQAIEIRKSQAASP